jgi:diacylglycerol kinase (ATP)
VREEVLVRMRLSCYLKVLRYHERSRMPNFKTMVIVNPNSSNASTAKQWPEIRKEIQGALGGFSFEMTKAMGDATLLTRKALHDGYEMIVSLGGDGTNNEVINGFFENDRPINPDAVFSTIPRGTGGDLRKTLEIPNDVRAACLRLPGRETRRIDCGRMTLVDHAGIDVVRYFINIASFGIGGDIDARVNRSSKALGGFLSFLLASVVSVLKYDNQVVDIAIDGKSLGSRKIFSCAVGNGRFFGGGMMGLPDAKIDDGLFDILLMGDLNRFEILTQMSAIYKGRHVLHPKIEVFRGREVVATSKETVLHDVDGEAPGRLPSTYRILPGAIRFKMPG